MVISTKTVIAGPFIWSKKHKVSLKSTFTLSAYIIFMFDRWSPASA